MNIVYNQLLMQISFSSFLFLFYLHFSLQILLILFVTVFLFIFLSHFLECSIHFHFFIFHPLSFAFIKNLFYLFIPLFILFFYTDWLLPLFLRFGPILYLCQAFSIYFFIFYISCFSY